jgi:hypothetical protein
MTLNKREKTLAAATGSLLALFLIWLLWSVLNAPASGRAAIKEGLETSVAKKTDEAMKYVKSKKRMADWQLQSLPSDVNVARTLYRVWLLDLIEKSKLRRPRIESGESAERKATHVIVQFTVRALVNLEQLTQFLHGFYSAGHLHLIRSLQISPTQNPNDLDVTIVVEALSLPNADRKDSLSSVPPQRPPKTDAAAYVKTIVQRNLFAPYQPPKPEPPKVVDKPPEPPKPDPFDPSKHAYVTGIVEIDGQRRVWLKARTTNETFMLQSGEKFKVGNFEGTVGKILPREVEIVAAGQSIMVPLGDNLKPDAKKDAAKPGDNPSAKPPEKPGDKAGPPSDMPKPPTGPGGPPPGAGNGPPPGFAPPSSPFDGPSGPRSKRSRATKTPANGN